MEEEDRNLLPSDSGSEDENLPTIAVNGGIQGGPGTLPGLDGFPHSGSNVVIEPPKEEQLFQAIHLEKKRWYILALFCQLGCTQGMIWNTWGPISSSAKYAFDWNDGTIALLSNWGPIGYILPALPFAWLMGVTGMRWATIITGIFVAVGAILRCITVHVPLVTILMHIGHCLNGIAGPVVMGGPPLISNLWFPVNQRTTATSIAVVWGTFGTSLPFILCPYMVRDVSGMSNCTNTSSLVYNSSYCHDFKNSVRHDIQTLMFVQGGLAVAIFLLIIIYFPRGPKHPPSITANSGRLAFVPGLKKLFTNTRFWFLAVPYGLSTGVAAGWGSVLDVILSPIGINETIAGWIGFSGTLGGMASGLFLGVFSDIFSRRMKLTLVILFIVASVSFLVFTLQCSGYLPFHSTALLFITNILGSIAVYGVSPLFYELGCETAFPVAEGSTNTLMTWTNNAVALVFLLVLMFPQAGTSWMNWCLTATVAACVPMVIFYKETYTRLDIDSRASQH